MAEAVRWEREGRIVRLVLNRPGTRNALSEDVVEGLVAGLERAHDDAGVSVAVISGEGRGFSSGGNLHELRGLTQDRGLDVEGVARWYLDGIQRIPLTMRKVDVVTVAAVHGHAIGAGCDLAAMCDLRVAADSAVFSESFLRVGIIPGDGGAWFLPRVVGPARAREMLFTARGVDAATALDWGLVSRVVPEAELPAAAMDLAREVAALPPQALREAKRLMREAETLDLAEHLSRAAHAQGRLQQTEDHREAISAILEKRAPSFTGR